MLVFMAYQTIDGYIMPNPLYTYVLNMINKQTFLKRCGNNNKEEYNSPKTRNKKQKKNKKKAKKRKKERNKQTLSFHYSTG